MQNEENYKLIKSGIKTVYKYYKPGLRMVINIDSVNNTISENTLTFYIPSYCNFYAPKFNDQLCFSRSLISYYNKNGNRDSLRIIKYDLPSFPDSSNQKSVDLDTTLILYKYNLNNDKSYSTYKYIIKNGEKKLLETIKYEYSDSNITINKIGSGYSYEDNYYLEYDFKGNLTSFYNNLIKNSFEYDEYNRKIKGIYENSIVTFEFKNNNDILPIKEYRKVEGKELEIITYKYE